MSPIALMNKKTIYIAYLMAGDGGMQRTLDAMLALVKGGVDILEIGVPFSDPIADGPIIQKAAENALANGVTLDKVLVLVEQFRCHSHVPLVLFAYFNSLLAASRRTNIFQRASDAGINAMLIVDLPLEESAGYVAQCLQYQIDPVFIVTSVTPLQRIQKIAQSSRGFLYYACHKGTTGFRDKLPDDFCDSLLRIKQTTTLPVVAGFGITRREVAKKVLEIADGFVVGSLFVDAIQKDIRFNDLTQLARQIDPRRGVL